MVDIFDQLAVDESDIFDDVSQEENSIESIRSEVAKALDQIDSRERKKEKKQITNELKAFIMDEIAKIRPKQNVIERTIQTKVIEPKVFHVEPKVIEAPPPPPQIIREIRVEVEKKDTKKYVEESKYLDLLIKISKLENQLKETRRIAESPIVAPGGAGVIGIPPPEPNPEGYVLTVNKSKAVWAASTGSGGGTNPLYIGDEATAVWRISYTEPDSDLLVEHKSGSTWSEVSRFPVP